MKHSRSLTVLFLFAFMAVCSEWASACYDADESLLLVCSECDGGFYPSTCTFGCTGDFCSESYGECSCGKDSFRVGNPSGQCTDEECSDLRRAGNKSVHAGPPAGVRYAEEWRGMRDFVLVPSGCSGTYDVVNGI